MTIDCADHFLHKIAEIRADKAWSEFELPPPYYVLDGRSDVAIGAVAQAVSG